MDILAIILKIAFAIVAVILTAIVLMQEGKGGGLGSAFGGAGGEAFGHGVGGINKFTSIMAGLLMAIALVLALLPRFA
jgi:preprotein translocase subunit SecG